MDEYLDSSSYCNNIAYKTRNNIEMIRLKHELPGIIKRPDIPLISHVTLSVL